MAEKTSLTQAIESLIEKTVAEMDEDGFFRKPLVGYSSADDPAYDEIIRVVGPHHLKPQDILPNVATVVSFFIPFNEELVKGNKGNGPVSAEWGESYIKANKVINRITELLAEKLSDESIEWGAVPATHGFDAKTLKVGWSHRSAAAVAGLGRFGLNRMLIGPEGCAGRYGTAFTSAKIEPSAHEAEELCLYFKNGKCKACVKACPVEALTEEGFDRFKCYEHLLEVDKALSTDGQMRDVCGKCLAACPKAVIKQVQA